MKILSIFFACLVLSVIPAVLLIDGLIAYFVWLYAKEDITFVPLFLMLLIPSFILVAALHQRLTTKTIARYGERANAIMEMVSVDVDPDRAENRETIRYVFSFVDASGRKHIRNFSETRYSPMPVQGDIVPTYPKNLFVRNPKLGEKFEVMYLKGMERFPIILNTGDSEFVRHIQEEHRQKFIRQLSERVSKLQILVDADPLNPERQKLYQQAQQDLHNYQQFGTEPMLIESFERGLVFKSDKNK
ncbi:hypothetical protein V6667_05670 [Neisseria leonii]|uniref:Uncharacterized protein n=1 Tax=Neisseria leonii TaxID=2995413 RepID=A0A9X4E713_9NEIS|nr:hypothetical protein [Neisseria sp. 51.81]MDD9328352.1 hypothetical protein [Neisseria sp. 51.81]